MEWFLKNHPDAIKDFMSEIRQKYGFKIKESGQIALFDLYDAEIAVGSE